MAMSHEHKQTLLWGTAEAMGSAKPFFESRHNSSLATVSSSSHFLSENKGLNPMFPEAANMFPLNCPPL